MESHPQAAKQAPTSVILQRYLNKTVQKEAVPDEDELVQGKFYGTAQMASLDEDGLPLQAKSGNRTGLPDNLKSGIENLSGLSMDDVRVHYNSPKPAKLHALAYTQGTDIHVAPGQEKHLGHEAWHVVQQKQGRVQPTMQLQGVSVNDDEGLEKEADRMGEKAVQRVKTIAIETALLGGHIHTDAQRADSRKQNTRHGGGGRNITYLNFPLGFGNIPNMAGQLDVNELLLIVSHGSRPIAFLPFLLFF